MTLRAHGRQVVFVKKPVESVEHVLLKAFLWALYLPEYPSLTVEVRVGDRYKPDVVAVDEHGRPVLRGEAGQVAVDKIGALLRRYPATHLVIAKWATRLEPVEVVVRDAWPKGRTAPVDLLRFPDDSAERFTDGAEVRVTFDDVDRLRVSL